MQVRVFVLRDVIQTVIEMYKLSYKYKNDVSPYLYLNFIQFFTALKSIPFKRDPDGDEWIQRPAATINGISGYADCDDKSIVLMSYCILKNIPARFVAVSNMPHRRIHHVYLEVLVNGAWLPADPTYPENRLFWERPFTKKIIFPVEDYK